MTDLPEPEYPAGSEGMLGENCYTATQMREYRNQALEDAAQIAEKFDVCNVAFSIRALKEMK